MPDNRKRAGARPGEAGTRGCQKRAAQTSATINSAQGASKVVELRFADTATLWKADDRRWFERNPNRSHRIRRAYAGEMETLGFDPTAAEKLPEGSARFAVVRQIQPGARMRRFASLEAARFPIDDEPAAHALFDTLAESDSGNEGDLTILDTTALLACAASYEDAAKRKAS